ncbi:zinc finger BED domain-containing protein 1-like [Rhizophagus irregularis DAOM 181602=DAOM 197198]|nr:zinc finger BED domain-containing protein 1-like [Rhizophagus irregularis DAOM 181602=DAOM 197198]
MAYSSDFYPNEDFNFEMTDVVLEQQIEAPESSKTSHESVITRKPHAIQGTLPFSTISSEIKEKGELPETSNIKYKHKHNIVPDDDADISKKVERLEQVQRKLGYRDILRCIQDVSTRWNLSYYAWDRLFFLKDAIIQLQTDLSTSTDWEIKKDGNRLKRLLLNDDEWELLDQLVDLLMPFEEATREFSGNSYIALSQVIPTKEMIFDLATEAPLNSDDFQMRTLYLNQKL